MSQPKEYEKPPPYTLSSDPGQLVPPPGYQPYPGNGQPPPPGFTAAPTYGSTAVYIQPVPANVIVVGGCPACRVGVLQNDFTCLGIFCAIFFFPLGLLCCLLMRQQRCSNCGALFGWWSSWLSLDLLFDPLYVSPWTDVLTLSGSAVCWHSFHWNSLFHWPIRICFL